MSSAGLSFWLCGPLMFKLLGGNAPPLLSEAPPPFSPSSPFRTSSYGFLAVTVFTFHSDISLCSHLDDDVEADSCDISEQEGRAVTQPDRRRQSSLRQIPRNVAEIIISLTHPPTFCRRSLEGPGGSQQNLLNLLLLLC